jgi:formate hydrogenlyase subunit 3/multisubunit Na+/H+ antiporter MnhD subunit
MISTETLLAAALVLPLGLLLACLSSGARRRMLSWLPIAPLPPLAAALLATRDTPLSLGTARLHLTFALDAPGAILLGVAALLWIASGAYASEDLRGQPNRERFAVCWLMTLSGCVGVFLAADMIGFYSFLALLTLGATGLITHNETPQAWCAGAVYLGLGLLAESFLLVAFVLLAAGSANSFLIRDAVAGLATSPQRELIVALLIAGFGIKAALVPLHFWMPLAYTAAPIPAAAVLSGAVVKASILGLIRFLPLGTALPDWGTGLVAVGLLGAFYGVAIGITQTNPRTVLAYSSVSQMGFIVAVIGTGVSAGDGAVALAVAFYAAHHVLVKGALFLAVGVMTAGGERPIRVLLPATVIALGLGGLPLTWGALAKLSVKGPLGDGFAGKLATLSAAGTTLLMLYFLRRLAESAKRDATAPNGLVWPWLLMALLALAVPWIVYVVLPIGTWEDALSPSTLWKLSSPMLLGVLLAFGLWRWHDRLPRVPEGDIAAGLEGAARMTISCGEMFERADRVLRQWPVASASLLVVTILFGAAMLLGH